MIYMRNHQLVVVVVVAVAHQPYEYVDHEQLSSGLVSIMFLLQLL